MVVLNLLPSPFSIIFKFSFHTALYTLPGNSRWTREWCKIGTNERWRRNIGVTEGYECQCNKLQTWVPTLYFFHWCLTFDYWTLLDQWIHLVILYPHFALNDTYRLNHPLISFFLTSHASKAMLQHTVFVFLSFVLCNVSKFIASNLRSQTLQSWPFNSAKHF